MADFRLQIPDEFIESVRSKLGNDTKVTDIARDALTLFNWALNEKAKGRLILSSDEGGEKIKQVTLSSLDRVESK